MRDEANFIQVCRVNFVLLQKRQIDPRLFRRPSAANRRPAAAAAAGRGAACTSLWKRPAEPPEM
jgi:hypothetical protein